MRKTRIYADHAATTQIRKSALREMEFCLEQEYANPSSAYSFSRSIRQKLRDAREQIAAIIGAKPQEIYFTSGGTESDNWAIKGSAFLYPGERKRIISSQIEHHAVLRSCEFLSGFGYETIYLPVDEAGVVDYHELEKVLCKDTALVSVMLANNEIGTIEPIRELAGIAHDHHVPFHTDAVQAVGHIPLSMADLGVDMLSASAHKFGGPKGIGFLYVREGTQIVPFHHGGAQESGNRAGTENAAAILAMAAALAESCASLESFRDHMAKLEQIILQKLTTHSIDYRKNGSTLGLPGLLSLSFRGADGERLMNLLDLAGISVSTGSACNSRENEISHVLKAIRLTDAYANGTIRISLGDDNTEADAQDIAGALQRYVSIING